jgi:hypothetical protein
MEKPIPNPNGSHPRLAQPGGSVMAESTIGPPAVQVSAEHQQEEFFTAEVSKEMGRHIPVAVMFLRWSEINIPDPPYHKSVSEALVNQEFRNFNALAAGYLVANIRANGDVALVDGRHRRGMGIRAGHQGWKFIVTSGLTIEEEARLFRIFQRRKSMTQTERLKGLLIERDQAALALQAVLHSEGFNFAFASDTHRFKIYATAALMRIYQTGTEKGVRAVLSTIRGRGLETRRPEPNRSSGRCGRFCRTKP